ncbi:hypothetical protein CDAR_584861 [Caerostris darwini]|uniref:Uncharacterized protein n=1 Tax=Caerostris darwini TaxID=1538125 RepID=A0AAV4QTA9_9ARAC|nr:hypothetical protein CDAR_584861 [Caerostris darwini]
MPNRGPKSLSRGCGVKFSEILFLAGRGREERRFFLGGHAFGSDHASTVASVARNSGSYRFPTDRNREKQGSQRM